MFGDDARSLRTISSSRGSSSSGEDASAAVAVGEDTASTELRRRNEELARRRDGSSNDNDDDGLESPAAALELEPLVERVARALDQRCSVRGGDLVRIFVLVD